MFRVQIVGIIVSLAVAAGVIVYVTHSTGSANQIANDVSSAPGAGTASDSLFHETNLAKALAVYDKKYGPGKVVTFKIEPGALKVESATGDWIVGKHLETSGASIPADAGSGQATFNATDIDPAVLPKLVKHLASKGVTLADINYFLVSRVFSGTGKLSWGIYSTKGDFTAHRNGSHVAALGSSSGSTPSTASITKQAKHLEQAAKSQVKGATDEAACIQKAGTDVSKIQACTGG